MVMKNFMVIVGLLITGVAVFLALPRFGRLPHGERRDRIEAFPTFRDGKLRNAAATPQFTGEKGFWGVLTEKRPADVRPMAPVPALKTDLHNIDLAREVMVWFGHSSYFLQVDGKRVLVDPVFCAAAPVKFINKPFPGTDIYTPEDIPETDYLIITHDHWDHLDYETIARLRERIGKVICPLGVGAHFERWGFARDRIVELAWGEQAALDGGDIIYCTLARHFSGRSLWPNRSLWASFLLQTPSQRVFIGGDGGYGTHFAEIGARFGGGEQVNGEQVGGRENGEQTGHPRACGIDLAILECGQYSENWRHIHMAPEQTALAARDLGARRFVAVHNSKFALSRHPWNEPLERVSKEAERLSAEASAEGISGTPQLLTPMIGEIVELKKTDQNFEKWWSGKML